MIFTLDEDVAEIVPTATTEVAINPQNSLVSSQKTRPRSPLRIKSHTMHRHKHVSSFYKSNSFQFAINKNYIIFLFKKRIF